jgi:hypothetical protein
MSKPVCYKRHRFPAEIIAHAVWLYFRFPLSRQLVGEMLLERGIVVSYEAIRQWALKFGPDYARPIKRKRLSRRDIWHLRSWSPLPARSTGCGGPSIRMDTCSIKSCRRTARHHGGQAHYH